MTANVRGLVTKGKLTQDKAGKTLSMVKGALDYSDFKDVDMVIEVSCLKTNSADKILAALVSVFKMDVASSVYSRLTCVLLIILTKISSSSTQLLEIF